MDEVGGLVRGRLQYGTAICPQPLLQYYLEDTAYQFGVDTLYRINRNWIISYLLIFPKKGAFRNAMSLILFSFYTKHFSHKNLKLRTNALYILKICLVRKVFITYPEPIGVKNLDANNKKSSQNSIIYSVSVKTPWGQFQYFGTNIESIFFRP